MKKLVIVILLLFGIVYGWYRFELRAVDASSEELVRVTIPEGTSTKGIGTILAEKNLIRSPSVFSWYARLRDATLQAGTFSLQKSMSASEIVEVLTSGKTEQVSVTIPEGYTLKDIDALLAEEGLITEGDAIKCAQTCDFAMFDFLPTATIKMAARGGKLEGYLYPDTYFVEPENFVVKFFLERMLGTFRKRVVTELGADIQQSGHSLHEIVTMASLIEEETRTADERPIVSGILWKRLENGVSLGVDAAVRYIVEKPSSAITRADLDVNSPYNLRKFGGLPPGPIASPSLSSINAALHPAESPYWYYLHGKDGVIRYAITNEEHNANRAKYLQ